MSPDAPRSPDKGGLAAVLSRPVSVSIGALGLVVLGAFSLRSLPVSLLPTLERPRLEVVARDADRSRDELEAQVVFPLERRLLALDGVLDVAATVDDGEASLVLETEWQTDVDRLRIDVERRLTGEVTTGLDVSVEVDAGDERPILQVAVGGGTAPRRTAFADKVLLPELGRLPGAGRLVLVGGADRRPVVRPRAADLAAHGLVAADLAARLEEVGRDQSLGRLRLGGSLRPLLLRQEVRDLEALAALPVSPDGLLLREVADVELATVPRAGVARVDGEPVVLVEVHRAPGANAVRLAREARRVVAELASRAAPQTVRVTGDGSREVVASLVQLGEAGLWGLVLGTLVLRALLGSWRPTFALVVVVPVSIVAAFSAFLAAGISLDLVSLAGLALAAGMLVDNSVVVLEAISSARERGEDDPVVAGSRQIALALVASFATTAVVFLPLVYLRGLARAFFGVQAFAIVSTLLISLVLSLSLTPVLARRLGAGGGGGSQVGRGLYLRLLEGALARPWPWLVVTVLVLGGVAFLVPRLPRELVPRGEARTLVAEARLPAALEQEEAERRLLALEGALRPALEGEEVTAVIVHRADERAEAEGGPEAAAKLAETAEVELRFASVEALERALPRLAAAAEVPGLEVRFRRRPSAVSAAIERTASALEVEVSASTPRRLEDWRRRVAEHLHEGGFETSDERGGARPAWWIRFDEVRLAALGADPRDLSRQLQGGLGSRFLGRAAIEGAEPDVHFAAPAGDPRRLTVRAGDEPRVLPLTAVADVERHQREPARERRGGRPTARLAVAGGLADADALAAHLAELPRAADVEVRLAGLTSELRRSFGQLRLALGLALVLVFLTVAALYESLKLPLVVMVTVPAASAGAFLALLATGQSFNVMSFLGLIVLAGIVVNNAIVLLHRAEQHRASGQGADEAVRRAAAERYRPILMTTLTTLLGMVPLALVGGDGLELRRALAVAVAGGLVTSWAAALLVVPVLYRLAMAKTSPAAAEARDA